MFLLWRQTLTFFHGSRVCTHISSDEVQYVRSVAVRKYFTS